MSDKFLSEAEWRKFSKGRDFKDAALLKALAGLDKAREPDQELEALAELDKQADLLRKTAKADKDLGGYLDSLQKALDKQRKLCEAEARKVEQEQGEDEEEETPALLTSKMLPVIRQVKKGEQVEVLIASTGQEVAVLLSRRAISPSRRKLLTDYLGGGTAKFYRGSCLFEDNAYTFVLQTQVGGLAKKIKAALLKQVELRLKVRVRGDDPDLIDDDGDADEGSETPEVEGQDAGATGIIPPPPPPPPPADPLKPKYEQRIALLTPRVLATLKAGAGDVSKIRAVDAFVREKAEAGNFKAALQGLDSLEKLLPEADSPPRQGSADPAAAFTARLAALMPAAKTAIAAGGEPAQEIKLKISEAGVFARKKEFDPAHALLDEAEALIEEAAAGPEQDDAEDESEEPPTEEVSPDQKRWQQRFAELEPEYLEILAAKPTDAGKLRAVMDYANGQAESGQYGKAANALDQLQKLMVVARSNVGTGTEDSGRLVRQRKFMLERWAKIPPQLRGQLGALRKAVADSGADDDPDGLVDAIELELDELLDELQDEMDAAINAGSTRGLRGVRARFEDNELVQHLRTGPGIDASKLLTAVLDAVDEIETEMTRA